MLYVSKFDRQSGALAFRGRWEGGSEPAQGTRHAATHPGGIQENQRRVATGIPLGLLVIVTSVVGAVLGCSNGAAPAPTPKRSTVQTPCWIEQPDCGGGGDSMYFVGGILIAGPGGAPLSPELRKKAAISLALSRYSFNLRSRVVAEESVRRSCSRIGIETERCVEEFQSRLELDTESLMKSSEFRIVGEFLNPEEQRYYLRIAVDNATYRRQVAEIIDFAGSQ